MTILLTEESVTDAFAKKEFQRLKATTKDAVVLEFEPEILKLVDRFGNSGQSGGSAPYVAGAITDVVGKLLLQKPIVEITGENDEWSTKGTLEKGLQQNKRCYGLFRKDGNPYYLDAIVFKDAKGNAWTGSAKTKSGKNISSHQNIKGFPFEPKTFVVDVVDKGDDFIIKDEKQLEEVFKYYKKSK